LDRKGAESEEDDGKKVEEESSETIGKVKRKKSYKDSFMMKGT